MVIKKNEVIMFQMPLEFFLPQWQMHKVEHLPVPFDITPFSSTATIAARPHKRDWVPITICTSPVIHLVCPQTFCICIMHCLHFLLRRL